MRVLFTILPSQAHLWPVTPCAWALQSAGHEVRVATHASFTGSVIAAGLTPVPLGDPRSVHPRTRSDAMPPARPEDVLRFADVLDLDDEGREHWIAFYQYLLTALSDFVRPDLPEASDLIGFAQAWQPDLVVWDPTMAAAPLAARACGAAHARLLLGLDYPAWCFDRLADRGDDVRAAGMPANPQAELVRPLAEKYGIDVDQELMYGQWSIDPMPPGMALRTSATTLTMRYVPYTGAESFPDWLHQRPRRPRVALTLGESTRRFIQGDWGRAPKIFEAVAGLDIEVIATLNSMQMEGIERVPDNVRTIEWVPLTQLLPTCSAVIHHGGGGTFAAPCAFKVPQIVCDTDETLLMRPVEAEPNVVEDGTYRLGYEPGDREDPVETVTTWQLPAKKLEATPAANYVVSRGAGTRLDHRRHSVDEIGDMIQRVVHEPEFQHGAQAIFDAWLAMPSPAAIVPLLERLTTEHRRR
jgi:glycosyltransferase